LCAGDGRERENSSQLTFFVHVVDTTPPVMSATPDIHKNNAAADGDFVRLRNTDGKRRLRREPRRFVHAGVGELLLPRHDGRDVRANRRFGVT